MQISIKAKTFENIIFEIKNLKNDNDDDEKIASLFFSCFKRKNVI